jgi:hypothetical protein
MKINKIKQAEFTRNTFVANPTLDTKFEDMLKPDYWAHVANDLKRFDLIDVIAADGSWFARLIVRAVGKLAVHVAVLSFHEFDKKEIKEEKNAYEIAWSGPKAKYRVVRTSDKAVIQDGLETKDQAKDYIEGLNEQADTI